MNVPVALKYLLMQFANKIIGCNMLTYNEDMVFYTLLSAKLKEYIIRRKIKLLYRGSENNFLSSKFHKLCDDHGPTIIIIKSNWGNIFGGYTSIKWSSDVGYHKDNKSFLFLIRSKDNSSKYPVLFDCIDVDYAVKHDQNNGPMFGRYDLKIGNECDKDWSSYTYNVSKINRSYNHNNELCGEYNPTLNVRQYFKIIDYSVFEII